MENASVQWGLFFTFRLFSLIRPGLRPVHLPRRGRLPPAGGLYFGPSWTCRGPLHTRPGFAGPPSPSRRGRGFPPAGASLTFPWGKVPPQRRMRGGTKSVLPAAPHPSGLRPATLSFGEGFFEIPRKKPFTFGNTYGRISPLVMASITFVPSAQLREKTQGGISPNPILS